jgi:glycosyltransferase involved in cell wall biosynthesis
MKIAFVHDWFKANGGAEKVAGVIIDMYSSEKPDIYALFNKFSKKDSTQILKNIPVKTSVMQRVPFIGSIYRFFLPLMPQIMQRFNLQGYRLILSTSHAVAKGFRSDGALHICYCHTPMRYIWDMHHDYASSQWLGTSVVYRQLINYLRRWDVATAKKVHYFIANSNHIAARIKASYGTDARVIYPPVRTDKFTVSPSPRKNYYLCVGRFVPYKKTDLVVRAFSQMPDLELVLIGDGYGTKKFKKLLGSALNIRWLGYQSDDVLLRYMQEARACIFAAKEDFGIMCVEAQACGTPVITLNYGGYKETVAAHKTGYFFDNQTEADIAAAVRYFEQYPLTQHGAIREHALQFSEQRFRHEFGDFVNECLRSFGSGEQIATRG